MKKTEFETVDEYLAAQPESTAAVLEKVRKAIRKALPKAEESISYNMPTYKIKGAAVMYFAGWKRHYSLYPATRSVLETFAKELAEYEIDKATIRLRLDQKVPAGLIGRIAKLRAEEVSEREKAERRRVKG